MLLFAAHLPRDLRALGLIAFVFGTVLLQASTVFALTFLLSGVVLFALAAGIARREKWNLLQKFPEAF